LEIEAKFFLPSRMAMRKRILALGARSLSSRYLERNLRLDNPDARLAKRQALLRLRQGEINTITYKQGTAQFEAREEVEIEVDDFDQALELLTAIGFVITATYEKYREVFRIDPVTLMLDEVPFGCFLEIEGPELAAIQESTEALGLDWDSRVRKSYLAIFSCLREQLSLPFTEITFRNFEMIDPVSTQELEQALA